MRDVVTKNDGKLTRIYLNMTHPLSVYKLPADSPLVDQECAICFEEFVAGK